MLLKYISSCTEVKGTGPQKRIRNLSRALSAILQKLRFICTSWKAVFPPSQGKSDPPPPWCSSPQLLPAEVAIPSSSALHNCFSNLNGLRKVSRKMLSPFSCPLTFEKAASKIETCLAKENSKVMKSQEEKSRWEIKKSPHPAYYLCERLVQSSMHHTCVKMVLCFCYLSGLEFGA